MSKLLFWLKANLRTVLIHTGVWILYLFLNNLLLFFSDLRHLYVVQMPFTFTLVAILFYTNVYAIVDPCIRQRQYVRLVLYTVLLLGLYTVLRYLLFYKWLPTFGITTIYTNTFVMIDKFVPDSLWLALQYILFSYGYWFALYSIRLEREKRHSERRIATLQAEKAQSELAFLRAQLNPHFLYNTLNFFFADALLVSPRLADSIMALSQMLRSVSDVGYQSLVSVGQELNYIHYYLKIQQYRFGDQLHLHLHVTGEEYEQQLTIPPLILISLVENIFKYGNVFDEEAPAAITVALSEDTIAFKSTNRKQMLPNYTQGGLGLANIDKQLNLVFGPNYKFDKLEVNDLFLINLQIKVVYT